MAFKVIALLAKKADLTRDEFIAYYENHHAPLILSITPEIRAYRRNFADFSEAFAFPDAAPFDFDCVTEIEYADRAAYEAGLARQTEAMDRIAADEENFLDRGKTRMFIVDSRASEIA